MSEPASEKLRFLAKARREYLPSFTEPRTLAEVEALSVDDLMIWTEARAAENLARYLETPAEAWGWLPSWRWADWNRLNPDAKQIP